MAIPDNNQNKQDTQKRILLATVLSFAFFIAYDFLYLQPQQELALANEKTKQSIELAEQAIENGKKVIIFTNFTHSSDTLIDHFGKIAVGHNGKLNDKQKQRSIDQFQENDNIKSRFKQSAFFIF